MIFAASVKLQDGAPARFELTLSKISNDEFAPRAQAVAQWRAVDRRVRLFLPAGTFGSPLTKGGCRLHNERMSRLDPRLLLQGYATGIFPMADSRDADELFWVEPRNRAIIPLDRFHVSRSLRRTLRSGRFAVTHDRDFASVITRLRGARGDLDQRRARACDAGAARAPATPIRSRSGRTRAGRGALRRQARPCLFRRKHVQPGDATRRRSRSPGSSLGSGRQFHPARLPVHDRSPGLAGRGQRSPRNLCGIALGGARRRRGGRRSAAARGRGARRAPSRRRTSSRSIGCSRWPERPAPRGPAGYVISQLLGQTS